MTNVPKLEELRDVNESVPMVKVLSKTIGIKDNDVELHIKAICEAFGNDPIEIASRVFRIGTLMGYLYAQKEVKQ